MLLYILCLGHSGAGHWSKIPPAVDRPFARLLCPLSPAGRSALGVTQYVQRVGEYTIHVVFRGFALLSHHKKCYQGKPHQV